MRFVVFLFGLLACPVTIAAGVGLLFIDWVLVEMTKQNPDIGIPDWITKSPTGFSNANTGLFIVLAGCYGLLGSLFTLFRCGRQGGTLMLVPCLLAGVLNPYFLSFMSFQMFVALLAFLVGPLPLNPPEDKEEDDDDDEDDDKDEEDEEDEEEEEEEEVKPKPKKKR